MIGDPEELDNSEVGPVVLKKLLIWGKTFVDLEGDETVFVAVAAAGEVRICVKCSENVSALLSLSRGPASVVVALSVSDCVEACANEVVEMLMFLEAMREVSQ